MTQRAQHEITRGRQALFIRIATDYASGYAQSLGQTSVPRYIAEQAGAHGWEWEWIEYWLSRNGWVYSQPPIMMSKIDAILRERRQESTRIWELASLAAQGGEFDHAKELIWKASILDPQRHDWDSVWAELDALRIAAQQTTTTERSTG